MRLKMAFVTLLVSLSLLAFLPPMVQCSPSPVIADNGNGGGGGGLIKELGVDIDNEGRICNGPSTDF